MCQATVISQHLGKIGRKSFDRRMRIASPLYVERRGDLARILGDVDKLCNWLRDEFPTITAEDYRMFGPELKIVISTLKALRRESLTYYYEELHRIFFDTAHYPMPLHYYIRRTWIWLGYRLQ